MKPIKGETLQAIRWYAWSFKVIHLHHAYNNFHVSCWNICTSILLLCQPLDMLKSGYHNWLKHHTFCCQLKFASWHVLVPVASLQLEKEWWLDKKHLDPTPKHILQRRASATQPHRFGHHSSFLIAIDMAMGRPQCCNHLGPMPWGVTYAMVWRQKIMATLVARVAETSC